MLRAERNSLVYETLRVLAEAYETGEFDGFVSYLDEDCVYESMWVMEPLCGYDAVSAHLIGKGKSLIKSKAFPDCDIVELIGDINFVPNAEINVNGKMQYGSFGLAYDSGELCLIARQQLKDKVSEILIRLQHNEEGKISRFDICDPQLFKFRYFGGCVSFYMSNDDDYDMEKVVYISDDYRNELRLFLEVAGSGFYLYDDYEISMDEWIHALSAWKEFVEADSFDAIFEKFAGVDYSDWNVANQDVLLNMGKYGAEIWKNRKVNAGMMESLLEWTNKYQKEYKNVYMLGY